MTSDKNKFASLSGSIEKTGNAINQKFIRFLDLISQRNNIKLLARLGYPPKTKLLIIHADDFGISHSENNATIQLFEKGTISSTSVMAPCYAFNEAAEWGKTNQDKDIGIHLTLTSGWESAKWKPVMTDKVTSLTNESGNLYRTTEEMAEHASLKELELELEAQIEKSLNAGIDVTHLDSHGFVMQHNHDLLNIYLRLGRKFNIPVMLNQKCRSMMKNNHNEKDVFVDRVFMASRRHYKKGVEKYYLKILKSLKPGLNTILLHPAYNNEEMLALTGSQLSFNGERRQADFDFFISDNCKQILEKENIQLITWREIRDKIIRS